MSARRSKQLRRQAEAAAATRAREAAAATRAREAAAVELTQLPIEEIAAATKPNGNGVAQNVAPRNTAVSKSLPKAKPAREPREPAEGITKAQQKILDALAAYEALGDDSADRASVAAFAGMKQGGHFNNSVSSLRTAGLIDYRSEGLLALTDTGRESAHAIELESIEDVHALWFQKRTALQLTILEVLIEIYPESIERADLAERIGKAEGGHFNNTVSSLRTLGALDYPTKGSVRASERLFPKALA